MRWIWGAASLLVVASLVGTIDSRLSEASAGLVVAACLVMVAVSHALAPLLALAERPLAVLVACTLGALTAGTALVPVLETLSPGEPVIEADLADVGAAVTLPDALSGPARVLLRAQLPEPPAHLQLTMAVGAQELHTELTSSTARVRLGRRGRGNVVQRHETALLDATVSPQAHELRLVHAAGAWPVPLHVRVYRELLPDWSWLAAGGVLLCLFALLGADTRTGVRVPGAIAFSLFFGFAAHYMATPDSALRPEIGAVFVAMLGAAVVAPVLSFAGERLTA